MSQRWLRRSVVTSAWLQCRMRGINSFAGSTVGFFNCFFLIFNYFDCSYPIRLSLSLTPVFKVMLRSNTSSVPRHRLRRINLPLNDKFARVPMISYFALGFYCSYKCFKYEIILFLKYKPFLYLLRENCQNFHFIETKYIHNEKRRRPSP